MGFQTLRRHSIPRLLLEESLTAGRPLQLMPCAGVRGGDPVGGQAVMEGVMMRAPHSYCVAVRKPSGEIVTEEKDAAAAI
jgi:Predicted metal-dependent enzyme